MAVLHLLALLLFSASAAAQTDPPGRGAVVPAGARPVCPSPAVDQTIQLPGKPFAAEPSPDNCYLFVSLIRGRDAGAVAVVANAAGVFRLVRAIGIKGGAGGGLSLAHDARLLAVAAEESIVLLDVARLEQGDQDPILAMLRDAGHGAIYTQFSLDDARLFVSEERNESIAVIDVAAARAGRGDKAITGRVPVGQEPVGLALSPDGTVLFSTSEVLGTSGKCKPEKQGGPTYAEGALIAIDVTRAADDPRHAALKAIRAGCNPVRVAMSADGHSLWVSQRGSNSVMGLDPLALVASAEPGKSASLGVGQSPVGLAIRPDGAQLWVSNSNRFGAATGSLTLVTPANPVEARLSGSLGVGAFPRDLRFMPDGRTLVVALFGDQAILVHPTGGTDAPQR